MPDFKKQNKAEISDKSIENLQKVYLETVKQREVAERAMQEAIKLEDDMRREFHKAVKNEEIAIIALTGALGIPRDRLVIFYDQK